MATEAIYTKSLGGAEDLLLDASNSPTVIQTRAGKELEITKINSSTIPYSGKFGDPAMVSIKDQLDSGAYTVDTVDDFGTIPSGIDTVIVKDLNRGGTFIYDATQSAVNNGGTIFDGWVRQFSGAVNVKWFGAKGDGITDDTDAIQKVVSLSKGIIYVKGTYNISNTITITSSNVEINATNAQINWVGTNTSPIYKVQAPIDRVTFNGGSYVGNASSFILAIGVTPDVTGINDYARFTVSNVHAGGMELFIDAQKAARYKVTQCQTYTKNGINNEGKIVEVKISDSVIYGSSGREAGSYGIRSILHPDTTVTGKYPEGLHITNSTIDGFGDDILFNDIFVSFISNVYASTITVHGNSNIYSTHCRDINISNCFISSAINLKQKIDGSSGDYYFLASGNEFNKFSQSGSSILIGNNVKRVSILNNNFSGGNNDTAIIGGSNNDYITVSGNTCDATYGRLYGNNGTGGIFQVITNNVDNGTGNTFSNTPAYMRDNMSSKKGLFTQIAPQTILMGNSAIESLQFTAVKGENFLLVVNMNCLAASPGYLQIGVSGTATISPSKGVGYTDLYKQLPTSALSTLAFTIPLYCSSSGTCTINFNVEGSSSLSVGHHNVVTLVGN